MQVCGIALTLVMGHMIRLDGDVKVNIRNAMLVASGLLFLGGILTSKSNLWHGTQTIAVPVDMSSLLQWL